MEFGGGVCIIGFRGIDAPAQRSTDELLQNLLLLLLSQANKQLKVLKENTIHNNQRQT